jgi:hypothetical protein
VEAVPLRGHLAGLITFGAVVRCRAESFLQWVEVGRRGGCSTPHGGAVRLSSILRLSREGELTEVRGGVGGFDCYRHDF